MSQTTMKEGEKKKEVKKGRHYLVHGQRSCPLKGTAVNRLQVHGQLQLSIKLQEEIQIVNLFTVATLLAHNRQNKCSFKVKQCHVQNSCPPGVFVM